jgi:hypothetical protein
MVEVRCVASSDSDLSGYHDTDERNGFPFPVHQTAAVAHSWDDFIGDGDRNNCSLQHIKWRLPVEDLDLADILQGKPDLRTIRRSGDIRAERARLRDLADDIVVGDGDDVGLRRKRRADITVFPVRRENRHAGAVRNNDPRFFLVGRAVEHGYIVLAPRRDPDSLAIIGKERLVRRVPA